MKGAAVANLACMAPAHGEGILQLEGLMVEQRARTIMSGTRRVRTKLCRAGDVSAWDTSWDPRHCDFVARLRRALMDAYDDVREPDETRRVKRRFVELLVHGSHG